MKEDLERMITDGKILLGDLVEPKRYEKTTINNKGDVVKEKYSVQGSKICLKMIRERIFKEHQKLGKFIFYLFTF